MKITILGSGNVATHFAKAFRNVGHEILQVWSRNNEHAQLLADTVKAQAVASIDKFSQEADICIVAISDDALFEIPQKLHFNNTIVLHTSGSVALQVLEGSSPHIGVLWSPQTYIREAEMDYTQLPFCVEGNDNHSTQSIMNLAQSVSPNVYSLNSVQRKWAHLSAVMVNNFGNALNASAQQLMSKHEIPFELLLPIIDETARKAHLGNLRQQQTGPAIRHDKKTLDAHRKQLETEPQLLELYNLMTRLIQQCN